MKKNALLTLACAALMSGAAFAQSAPEVTYVEDPAQGYTFNRFKDNWFITLDGGVNVLFSKSDKAQKFGQRIAPALDLEIGKWFSPILGTRVGFTYLGEKGVSSTLNAYGIVPADVVDGKYYKTHVGNLGFNVDGLLNITNWWCGYKPNRVYNFIVYGGAGAYFGAHHKLNAAGEQDGWTMKGYDTSLFARVGIINSFNVSKQVALSLDIRYTAVSAHKENNAFNTINSNVAALLGVTYLFNNRTWTAPIVPVCPPAENCDAIAARLAEAEARLADTQRKLDECLRRPVPTAKSSDCVAPLATVYFPIGSANVDRTDRNVLKSVAGQMNANTSTKYDVCGWADNYTGTDAVNQRLRENRANNVKNILISNGVDPDQLNVTTNPGDRYGGQDNVYLDRCVTIQAQ